MRTYGGVPETAICWPRPLPQLLELDITQGSLLSGCILCAHTEPRRPPPGGDGLSAVRLEPASVQGLGLPLQLVPDAHLLDKHCITDDSCSFC